MFFDITTIAPTMPSYMNFISHASVGFVGFSFFKEVELIGFHDNLFADFNGPVVNQNRL